MDRDQMRVRLIAVLVGACVLAAAQLGLRSGAGEATGSRLLSALRNPSTAPLPVPFGFPPAKAARFRAMDRLRQRAASIPAAPPSQDSTAAGLTAGILGLHDGGPFNATQFVGTNLWNGPLHRRWLVVQAGGVAALADGSMPPGPAGASRARAAVFVYWRGIRPDASTASRVVGVIRAPGHPAGELIIRSARGGVLEIALTGTSRVYRFDLARLRFVS
jgi:hypothetical protein